MCESVDSTMLIHVSYYSNTQKMFDKGAEKIQRSLNLLLTTLKLNKYLKKLINRCLQ